MTILESGDYGHFGYMNGYRLVKFSSPGANITHVYYMYVASDPYDSATDIYNMAVVGNETVGSVAKRLKMTLMLISISYKISD